MNFKVKFAEAMQTYDWIGIYLNFELNSFTHWHIFPRFSLQTVRPPSFVASSEFIIIFCKSNGSQLSLEIILWELWIEFDAYLVKLSEHILPLVAVTVLIRRHIFGRQSSYRWHYWNYCVRFTLISGTPTVLTKYKLFLRISDSFWIH